MPSPTRWPPPITRPPERATIRRAAFLLVLLVALGAFGAGVAQAGSQVDAAVQARGSAPIYSAPGAQLGLSSAERSRVERAIADEQPGPVLTKAITGIVKYRYWPLKDAGRL